MTDHRTIADRYELGPPIGSGGVADVHRGTDLRLNRPVAIKLLRGGAPAQMEATRRFEAEARAAAKIDHPNVVQVYDAGHEHGTSYIVMEYVHGPTLADEIASGPLEPSRVRDLAGQVLAALAAAHRQGIVHRDVKPGNILLAPDGTAKVTDFGIAKAEDVTITATGLTVGTPAYLAPELFDGEPPTPRSDVYSAGVVLYESLAGRRPFTGETSYAVAHAVKHDEPDDIRAIRPDVDPALASAIMRALSKRPQSRFASAEEMSSALQEPTAPVETDDPTEVIRRDATEVLERPGPRRRALSRFVAGRWLVAAAVIALLVLAIVLTLRDTPEPTTTPAPAAETEGELPPELEDALDRLEEAVQP